RQTAALEPPEQAGFVYSWIRGLQFSPDGKELAAFSIHPQPRILCWNSDGKLIFDELLALPSSVGPDALLEWLPPRSGWLVHGNVVDRASKRLLLRIRVALTSYALPHVLDRDRIIGAFGPDTAQLRTLVVPWTKLAASVRQLDDKAPAFLSPS